VGAVLTLGGLGYGLDRLTGSAPWFLFIGLLSGLGVGLYGIVKAAARR
jgi:F0F1-type ATP synthase assembly protein I